MSGFPKTLDDYKELAYQRGGRFTLFEIPKRTKDQTDGWYCYECNSNVSMNFQNLQKSKQFSCCSPSRKKTLQDYKNIAILRGGTYILDYIPENAGTPVEGWCCKKDHTKDYQKDEESKNIENNEEYIWSTCYNSIANGSWCAICSNNKPKTLLDYQQLCKSIGWEYILTEIPSGSSIPIKGFKCPQAHFVETSFSALKYKGSCAQCYGNAKKVLADYLIVGKELNFKYILDHVPENTDIPIFGWRCMFDHEFETTYGNIRDKRIACPKCPKPAQSSYEIRIERLLNMEEFKFSTQFSLDIHPAYKYDFCIRNENKEVLLEIDGRQHFEYIDHFHGTEEYYQRRRNDDILKTQHAKDGGYKLIRLDYKYLDRIGDQSLMEFIKSSLSNPAQFITSNDSMYQWIFETVYPPKLAIIKKPILKLLNI
jgi:very-short-patch-repair endonuclease